MNKLLRFSLTLFCTAALLFQTGTSFAAQSAEEFYRTHKVTLIIGTKAGGGADFGGRLLAKYWKEVTGGDMIVKNMPGAAGVVGLNYMANSVKPDGLTMNIIMYAEAYLVPCLTKSPVARYDASKFNYIAGCFLEPWFLVQSEKFKTIDDLRGQKELKYGAMLPYGSNSFIALPLFDTLDLKAKVVTGYQSQPDVQLAVGKGEIDFTMAGVTQTMRQVDQGVLPRPLLVMDKERCPAVPDIPALPELVSMTPEQQQLFEKSLMLGVAARMLAMPEGVPQDRVQYARKVIRQIASMPAFDEEAKKVFLTGGNFMLDEELDAFIKETFALNFDEMKQILDKYITVK